MELVSDRSEAEPVEAVAFRRFREGASPLDLVEEGITDPTAAKRLRKEFNELAGEEYRLMTGDELADLRAEIEAETWSAVTEEWNRRHPKIRERARQHERARLRDEFEAWAENRVEEAHEEFEERLPKVRKRAYQRGRQDGREAARAAFKEELEAIRTEVEEEREAMAETVEEVRAEAYQAGRDAGFEAGLETGERVGYEEAVMDAEGADFAAVYVEGRRAGFRHGVEHGVDEGKINGFATVLEAVTSPNHI